MYSVGGESSQLSGVPGTVGRRRQRSEASRDTTCPDRRSYYKHARSAATRGVPAFKRPGILGPFSPGLNTRKQRKKEKQGSYCWKVFAAAPRSPIQGSSKSQDQSDAHDAKKQAGGSGIVKTRHHSPGHNCFSSAFLPCLESGGRFACVLFSTCPVFLLFRSCLLGGRSKLRAWRVEFLASCLD